MIPEPKSTNQIIVDMLEMLINLQWRYGEVHYGSDRFDEVCPKCLALYNDGLGEHKEDCDLNNVIEQTRAYLRAENEILEKNSKHEEILWIP